MKDTAETRIQLMRERMEDKKYRPEHLRTCATMGSNSASIDIRFPDVGYTIGNTISCYKETFPTVIEEVIKMCVVEAMRMGYTEEQCKKREIVWLSINGRIVIDK